MRSIVVLCTVLCMLSHAQLIQGGVNKFRMEDFTWLMNRNKVVLAFVTNVNCVGCMEDRWNVHKVIFNFMLLKDFYVIETAAGELPEFDVEFGVNDDQENPQFFLFKDGNRTPWKHDQSGDLADWISKVTEIDHYPDHVVDLTKDNYHSFMKKNPKRNVIVMMYAPAYEHTHYVVANFYRNAFAFHDEYKAVFAKLDCGKYTRFCQHQGAKSVLSFKFNPAEGNKYDGEELLSLRGEKITDFMNRHCDTRISGVGGMNEQYGRYQTLDLLAHEFMETNDEGVRNSIVKKVVKLRKRFATAGKYYSVMKMILAEGKEGLKEEKKRILDALKETKGTEDKEYFNLRARQNVIKQFCIIKTKKTVVHLDPWNFDYIVNGKTNVMMLINTNNCLKCNLYKMIYQNAAREGLKGVIFADINGDKFPDFVANFNVNPEVFSLWFRSGKRVSDPMIATFDTSIDAIVEFAKKNMDPVEDDGEEEVPHEDSEENEENNENEENEAEEL